jgi:hypothetical protein
VLLSQSPPRIPTLEQSQLAQNLQERVTSKPVKSWPLSSSASFTEDFSISPDKMRHQGLDSTKANESMPNISGDIQMSEASYSKRKSFSSSFKKEGFWKSTRMFTQEESLQREKVSNCCTCGQVPRMFTDDLCTCSLASCPSLNSSHGHEDSLHVTDKQESSNLHMIEAVLMASSNEISFDSHPGHIALPYESLLQENGKVSRVNIMRLI